MTPNSVLIAGLFLAFKHFLFDGPAQTPYQYLNKGKWGHPGGLLHACLHGVGTLIAFLEVHSPWAISLAILDAGIHYVVDWTKMNVTAKYGWSTFVPGSVVEPKTRGYLKITSDWYFYGLVADQSLHFATYITLIWLSTIL